MNRWLWRLAWGITASAVLLTGLLVSSRPPDRAWAQGVGLWQRATCSTITSPVSGATWCFDSTIQGLTVYDGTKFATVTTVNAYVLNIKDFGAKGDGTTDDTAAINNTFAAARALGVNAEIYIPCSSSVYRVTSSINAGGFGNAPPTVRGCGGKNTGSRIQGAFSTANQPVVDFSGNEGGGLRDLTILGDSTTTPAYGLLLAGAIVGGGTRGGVNYLDNVQVAGTYTIAAIAVRSADLVVLNRVIAGIQVPSGSAGVAVYVVNYGAVTPAYTIASAFHTLSDAAGLTQFSSMGGVYSLAGNLAAGTTNRSAWLVEGISGIVTSVNDAFVYGGITASGIEFVKSGNALNVFGVRHESGGGAFIKTDGFKNSTVSGNAQRNGATPLIDVSSAYGTGDGIISTSTISLGASAAGANLFNATANAGLLGNTITLTDHANLTVTGGAQTQGNLIVNRGTGTVALANTNSDFDGNVVIGTGLPGYISHYGVQSLVATGVPIATTVLINASATITNPPMNFTDLAVFLPTDGMQGYCGNCDPTATLLACTSAGARTGAMAFRTGGNISCIGR